MGFSRSLRNLNTVVMYEHYLTYAYVAAPAGGFRRGNATFVFLELLIFIVSRVELCSQSLNVNPVLKTK